MSTVLYVAAYTPVATLALAASGIVVIPLHTRRQQDRADARATATALLADRSWRAEQLRRAWYRADMAQARSGAHVECAARRVCRSLARHPLDPRPAPGVDTIRLWWAPPAPATVIGRPPVTAPERVAA